MSAHAWLIVCVLALCPGLLMAQRVAEPTGKMLLRVFPDSDREVTVLERQFPIAAMIDRGDGRLEVLIEADSQVLLDLVRTGWDVDVATSSPDRAQGTDSLDFRVEHRTMDGFSCYRTLEETETDLAALAAANPQLAQWIDFGDSWEKVDNPYNGEDLQVLVLGNTAVEDKAPFVIGAAMHARELVTAETVTRLAELLISLYSTDADVRFILDTVEIHIMAQLNPDGRKKVEAALPAGPDIWWRKNTNPLGCATPDQQGVDLNRNNSFQWVFVDLPCSTTYPGGGAGSEPETMAVENYLQSVFADQRGEDLSDAAPLDSQGIFVSMHSFGEIVYLPWEFTNGVQAPNRQQLDTLGRKAGYLTSYDVCADCAPPISGSTVDFAYGELGVAAYTFELGTSFHQSCDYFEQSILDDILDSLIYYAKAARRPYQWPAGPEVRLPELDRTIVSPGDSIQLTATADDTRYASGGHGDEPTQNVVAVYYTLDVYPWTTSGIPLTASDGGFDSSVEDVEVAIDSTGLDPGLHTIYLVAEDASGALGVPSAISFEVPIFEDGFESGDTSAWSL